MTQFGSGSLDLSEKDFIKRNWIIQLGMPPNRIEIFTDLPGVEFKKCFPTRAQTEIEGVAASFIDLDNLKKNKKKVGRKQDLADLESLK